MRLVVPLIGLAGLLVFSVAYWIEPDIYQRVLQWYGFRPFAHPFFDLEFISTVTDCWRRGSNVYLQNPCDLQNRPMTYSPLWLRASFVPAGYTATVWMGLALDSLVFISLYWIIRPIRRTETLVAVLCCCSTMVVFALERANVDVLLFLFFVAAILLANGPLWRRLLAYAIILLAGLLKFYPFVALALMARERLRWFLALTGLTVSAMVAFVLYFKAELIMMQANIPTGSVAGDLFGANNLPHGIAKFVGIAFDTGPATLAMVRVALWVALLLAACMAALFWMRAPGLVDAFDRVSDRTRLTMTMGSLLIAGCFFAGQSVGYRGIFLIFVVAALIELRRMATTRPCRRALAVVTVLAVGIMWEGVLREAIVRTKPVDFQLLGPFLLVRELLWWSLITFLLAMIGLFAARTVLMADLWALLGRQRSMIRLPPAAGTD